MSDTTADQRLRDYRRGLLPTMRAAEVCEDLAIAADAISLLREMLDQKAEMHVAWKQAIDELLTRAGRA